MENCINSIVEDTEPAGNVSMRWVEISQFGFLFSIDSNSGATTTNLTPEQRQQVINECVQAMISPADLARRWNCNADTIRTWVREAGLTLPKLYKKSIFPVARDGGLVVHEGGKNDAENNLTKTKTKTKLDNSKTFKMVFCHLEFLRSSSSPDLHLTQLAAFPFPAAPDHLSVFLPVVPPVLVEYLDHYKVGGDLMQTLTMIREGSDTFLFRPPILVEEVQRVVCVPESAALRTFLDFLEMIGPNIILVSVILKIVCEFIYSSLGRVR